jgi:hypothetical protein
LAQAVSATELANPIAKKDLRIIFLPIVELAGPCTGPLTYPHTLHVTPGGTTIEHHRSARGTMVLAETLHCRLNSCLTG